MTRACASFGLASWPLAAFIGWTGLSLAWSKDVNEGAIQLLAFYIPFALLALTFARLPWSRLGVRALYAELTVMALAFAVVGFYQYETRDIFQNPKVIYANAYAPFFRVNSVFWDPSVYGRFLVLAMVPSIVLIVRGRSLRWSLVAAAALVVTWLGLLISYSQSSFAALLVVVIGAAFVAWRWRALVAVVLAVAVLAGNLGRAAAGPAIAAAPHVARPERRDERPLEPRRERDPHRRAPSADGCRRGRVQARVR